MSVINIYQATDGHFAPAPVKVRKFPADLSQTREVRFTPLAADGETAVKVMKYRTDAATFAAWLAETDAVKRAAILDGIPADARLEVESAISPTREQVAGMRTLIPSAADMLALSSAGFLVIPSTRGEKSASGKAEKVKATAADRAAAAFALMFPEPEVTMQDVANAVAALGIVPETEVPAPVAPAAVKASKSTKS
jgi:hypothetical protein